MVTLAPEPPPPARSASGTPIPDDFELPPEVRQQAIEDGHDPDEIADDLIDWALDRGHRSADWPAVARRWVRRERKFNVRQDSRSRPRSAADAIAERYFGGAAA